MSGTATCPWALVDNARERGLQLAASLGCNIENGTETIVECLKQKPSEKILRAVKQFIVSKKYQFISFKHFQIKFANFELKMSVNTLINKNI